MPRTPDPSPSGRECGDSWIGYGVSEGEGCGWQRSSRNPHSPAQAAATPGWSRSPRTADSSVGHAPSVGSAYSRPQAIAACSAPMVTYPASRSSVRAADMREAVFGILRIRTRAGNHPRPQLGPACVLPRLAAAAVAAVAVAVVIAIAVRRCPDGNHVPVLSLVPAHPARAAYSLPVRAMSRGQMQGQLGRGRQAGAFGGERRTGGAGSDGRAIAARG